jgi:hypothetical protein
MAHRRIREWQETAAKFPEEIDAILRGIAYSPMADEDPEKKKRAEARAAKRRELEGLYPGDSWRAHSAQK